MLRDTIVHLLRDNYTEAKIRGKKSFLLERQQFQSLTEFRSQSEIVAFLADTPYGPDLSKLSETASSAEVERTLAETVTRTVENLQTSAKGNVRQFIVEYRKRSDARDLANLIVYKLQGRTWEEYSSTRSPMGTFRDKSLRKLYGFENHRELLEEVEAGDEELEERLSDISTDNATPDKVALIRDIVIGRGEEKFHEYVRHGLHGRDRATCLPIVGSSIDLANIAIILRGKLLGLADIKKHLIPVSWKLGPKTTRLLIEAEDIQQALDRIGDNRYYRHVLAGPRQKYEETKSLSFLEVLTREHLTRLSRDIFRGLPYTIGVVLAFLTIKEMEARNLAAIVSGVEGRLTAEQIRPLLAA